MPVLIRVEPNFDPVGIAQADEHCSAFVALDDLAVRFAELFEPGAPALDVVPGRYEQGDGVESGQGPGAFGVAT